MDVTELISGLVVGLFLIAVGVLIFRARAGITSSNAEQRRPVLGRFLTEAMRGGDRATLPMMAASACVMGAALIVFTIYSVATGRGH